MVVEHVICWGAIATLLNFSSEIATKNLARKVVFIITCDEETDMQSIKYILAKKFDFKVWYGFTYRGHNNGTY